MLFYQDDASRSNLQSYTINAANTWEYKTITIDGDTAGVIDDNVHTGLQVFFTLDGSSDYTGTPHTGWGAYSETDDFAHSDMVDFSAQTGTWYLTGVQLETGTTATAFEHISFHENQRMCMRYYQKSYNVETALGTATQVGAIYQRHESGSNVSNRCVLDGSSSEYVKITNIYYLQSQRTIGQCIRLWNWLWSNIQCHWTF